MLFLVLFATLAIGFSAAVSTSMQVSSNEQRTSHAMLAAESGMQFIRFHLARLDVPASTPADELFGEVFNLLAERLDNTANLPAGAKTIGMSADGTTILIPAGTGNHIRSDDSGGQFRVTIEQLQAGQQLRVKVVGKFAASEVERAIQLDYAVAQNASSIFNFGVASRSPIVLTGNTSIAGAGNAAYGSVLSTTYDDPAITLTGNAEITGDVSMTNPDADMDIAGNCKIGGYKPAQAGFASHVHYGVEEPEFPVVDTSLYEPYATNPITSSQSGNKTFSNIRIKANSNPSFSGNMTILGVVYIETPNRVSFSGNLNLQGVIVVQNDPTGDVNSNVIDFGGNVSFQGVETLPASYGNLRQLTGAMLLAPTFHLKMRGNFGVIGGSIVASKTEFSGNAGGTVKGSILNLENTAFSLTGNTDLVIESQGTADYPAGVYFGSHYAPLPHTYAEVQP